MKRKIAVSVPEQLADEAHAAVAAGKAPSVSAYVSEAMAEKARRDGLLDLLDGLDRDLGAPGEEDQAWARRVLGL